MDGREGGQEEKSAVHEEKKSGQTKRSQQGLPSAFLTHFTTSQPTTIKMGSRMKRILSTFIEEAGENQTLMYTIAPPFGRVKRTGKTYRLPGLTTGQRASILLSIQHSPFWRQQKKRFTAGAAGELKHRPRHHPEPWNTTRRWG